MPNFGTAISGLLDRVGGFVNSLPTFLDEAVGAIAPIAGGVLQTTQAIDALTGGRLIDVGGRRRNARAAPVEVMVTDSARRTLSPVPASAAVVPSLRSPATALPGGAVMPMAITSLAPLARQALPAIGGAIGGALIGGGNPSGGLRSPFGSSLCIMPRVNAAGQVRFPKQVQFQVSEDQVETYVRAPKQRWKVVRQTTRRCRPR